MMTEVGTMSHLRDAGVRYESTFAAGSVFAV
jgi:hypothetical protein